MKPTEIGQPSPNDILQLKFDVPAPVHSNIEEAKQNAKKLISSLQSKVLAFSQYGKKYITSKKLSPGEYS
jgi:hypothetical protein